MRRLVRLAMSFTLEVSERAPLLHGRMIALQNDLHQLSLLAMDERWTLDQHHARDLAVALEDLALVCRRIRACQPRGNGDRRG